MDLFWRSEGQDAGSWTLLRCYPETNAGFTERGRYLIRKPDAHAQLYLDDEPLADAAEPGNWQWEPGFYAGEVTAELSIDGEATLATYLLDVAPDETKLGRALFLEMVQEVQAQEPELLLGSEPATGIFGHSGHVNQPWVSFARLRRYFRDMMTALKAVEANPRRVLQARRELMPLHSVRRADRRTALSASRIPGLLFEARDDTRTGLGNSLVDVPHFEETIDSPANRALRAMQESVLRRIRETEKVLSKDAERESLSDTRSPLHRRWPRRLAFLRDSEIRLRQRLGGSLWSKVARADVSAAGLTAIAADPIYSRVWSLGWKALCSGLLEDNSEQRLWLSPSWEIYEKWCYIRIALELRRIFPDFQRSGPCVWAGARGGARITLEMQPTFRAGPKDGRRFWSLSRERIPDILLTIGEGDGVRFLALDAKYRSSRENVLDAMSSAHIYNDSLRIHEKRPEAAILLIPRGGGAPWLEEPEFHLKHRVGTHVFNSDTSCLPDIAIRLLASMSR